MINGIYTLDDFELEGKTVLTRLDMNSPIDPETKLPRDITRIKNSVPTLRELSKRGAKTVILIHQGGDREYHNFCSTEMQVKILRELMDREVLYVDDVCFEAAQNRIRGLKNGEILMLENVRYLGEEMNGFENTLKLSPEEQAKTVLVRKLAPLADLYVNDAFAASHRSQPSLVGFQEVLPSAMGRLFETELTSLNRVLKDPERPCVFVLGGAKIEDAFMMMTKVLRDKIADKVLTTGLVSNVMTLSKGVSLGIPSEEFIKKRGLMNLVEESKGMLAEFGDKLVLPVDFAYPIDGKRHEIDVDDLPVEYPLLDIGSKTVSIYEKIIKNAKVIFFNGPAGVFEKPETEYGTKAILTAIANSEGFSAIGGGESLFAVNKYNLSSKIDYISTGGGALIRYISEGENLPVIKALKKSAQRFSK
jgi:phosphoglycerate kinase